VSGFVYLITFVTLPKPRTLILRRLNIHARHNSPITLHLGHRKLIHPAADALAVDINHKGGPDGGEFAVGLDFDIKQLFMGVADLQRTNPIAPAGQAVVCECAVRFQAEQAESRGTAQMTGMARRVMYDLLSEPIS